jgi:hypothetical protein
MEYNGVSYATEGDNMSDIILDQSGAANGFASDGAIVSSRGQADGRAKVILRREISDFEALPGARAAAYDLSQRIAREERKSVLLKTRDIKVSDDCVLTFGDEQHVLTRGALPGLCRMLGHTNGGAYLASVSPELRAHNLRTLLAQSDKAIQLRTRNNFEPDGGRQVYALVSADYPQTDAAAVLQHIASTAPTDAKADWRYQFATTRVEFRELQRQEINPDDYVYNKDVFQIGKLWSILDNGAAAIRAALLTFRRACTNMIIVRASDEYMVRTIHRGDDVRMGARLRDTSDRMGHAAAQFTQAWNGVRKVDALPAPTMDYAVKMYELLIQRGLLPTAKADAPLAVAGMAMAWSEEPGVRAADIINGVTRYARDMSVHGNAPFMVEDYEAAAGALTVMPYRDWQRLVIAH